MRFLEKKLPEKAKKLKKGLAFEEKMCYNNIRCVVAPRQMGGNTRFGQSAAKLRMNAEINKEEANNGSYQGFYRRAA